jgi:hypothetical protein
MLTTPEYTESNGMSVRWPLATKQPCFASTIVLYVEDKVDTNLLIYDWWRSLSMVPFVKNVVLIDLLKLKRDSILTEVVLVLRALLIIITSKPYL